MKAEVDILFHFHESYSELTIPVISKKLENNNHNMRKVFISCVSIQGPDQPAQPASGQGMCYLKVHGLFEQSHAKRSAGGICGQCSCRPACKASLHIHNH